MLTRMTVTEGREFELPLDLQPAFRSKLWSLSNKLQLSFRPFSEQAGYFTIFNLIGSIDLGGFVLDVLPKTEPADDWVTSIIALLESRDKIDIGGRRRSGLSPAREGLADALAKIFQNDLTAALRRDGPITAMVRSKAESPVLRGKLIASALARNWSSRPGKLPQTISELNVVNDFTKILAAAALQLGGWTSDHPTKNALYSLSRQLVQGEPIAINMNTLGRSLPVQWSTYKSSWAIANAVLSRRSLLGPGGLQLGPALVIEPWPLLERLLERCLGALASHGQSKGRNITWTSQHSLDLLQPSGGGATRFHQVRPDGIVYEDDRVVATFEAKYRDYRPDQGPLRSEIYQAISAATAASAPISVLVYPGNFPPSFWQLEGASENPTTLVTVGLHMFSYRWGDENDRGNSLYDLVTKL